MTALLYRPVLIESAEQAEALPALTPYVRFYDNEVAGEIHLVTTHAGLVGDVEPSNLLFGPPFRVVALVPIEAEEEWKTLHEGSWHLKADEDDARNDATAYGTRRRYTTDWEEA